MAMPSVVHRAASVRCTTATLRRNGRPTIAILPPAACRILRSSAAALPWHRDRIACAAVRAFAASSQPPDVSSSRRREVDAACAALAESVVAGDLEWFERVAAQLRAILEQRQAVRGEERQAARGEAQATASAVSTGIPEAHTGAPSTSADLPRFWESGAAGAPPRPIVPPPESLDESSDEPPWAQALRLLEEAAAAAAPPATPLSAEDAPDPDRLSEEIAAERMQAYLSSFAEGDAASSTVGVAAESAFASGEASAASSEVSEGQEEEPAWARALRLLEAVPAGGFTPPAATDSKEEAEDPHAVEDERMERYEQLLSRGNNSSAESSSTVSDARQALRISRYQELLREAENVQNAGPGASIPSGPLRFQPSTPSPNVSTGKPGEVGVPPPPPVPPPTKGPAASEPPAQRRRRQRDAADDPLSQAVGRGNLVSARPQFSDEENIEDGELRKEDFVWSEHEFNDGEKENKRVLRGFTKEFKTMAAETPEGLRSPKLLTAALDLALACVKCYELDKADAIFRRCLGECRRRGMPWDVKCLQDMATLRCKQHRQADAAELLEELANKAPPHPATFINLGTVYNQLKQYEKAESWFLQAVNLKGGKPGREDDWNLGICKKNMGKYDEALPMLERALAEFKEHEPDHPVTIAKLHSSVAGCLHDMGRSSGAVEHYSQACELYVATVGRSSPLHCSAAEGLAKALQVEGRFAEAFDALVEAFEVHAKGDAVHPTPLFENLELALQLREQHSAVPLERLALLIDAGVENLDSRGQVEDGNAGLVMSRGGKVLSLIGDPDLIPRARELLERGVGLIRYSHEAGEANLAHEIMEAETLLRSLSDDAGSATTRFSEHPSYSPVGENLPVAG